MPANFPSSPTLNQTYSYNGSTWSWTGSYWRLETSQAMTGIAFTYGNAAPSSPNVGDRWIDTTTMLELVYVYDGNSYQWVELSSQAPSTNLAAVSTSITPTANVAYDLGSNTNRWRDLYLSGNSLIIGGATITATGSAIALPSGTTVGGQSVASGGDVATGGGPKITNLQITDNSWTVLDDTAVDTAGGYVLITGTNFVSGALVYLNQTPATSVAFVSATTLRVTVPALTASTYVVYVINPDGGTAIRVPGLTASANPAWQTASALPEQYDGAAITLNLVATDATSYTLTSGSLPPGLSLNTGTGAITGTITGVTVDTVYTFTVRATDAQNQDSPRTFTVNVAVSDTYFRLTTLLLSGSAIPANTVVRDSSTNNFNLTVFGDARASNFTPYGTGWSVYFDGTGDYLSLGNNNPLPATGDFTFECWIYVPSLPGVQSAIIANQNQSNRYMLWLTSTGGLTIQVGASFSRSTGNNVIAANRWYHIATTRTGTTHNLFVDGIAATLTTSGGSPASIDNTEFFIGINYNSSYAFTGYISNFRVVTSILYTSTFTPSTGSLTAITNTSLLTCHANRFLDGSTNNFAITRNGDAKIVSFNPFNITNTGVNGSAYFDGTGDYLTVAGNSGFAFGTGDFTIECWVNPDLINTATFDRICATSNYNGTGFDLTLNNGAAGLFLAGTSYGISSIPIKAWSHLVYTRSGTTVRGFLNGKLSSHTTGASQDISSTATLFIAHQGHAAGGSMLTGYLADLRIIKGSIPAAYQTASTTVGTQIFTPPTQPLTAIANTQLLTLQYDQPHNNHTFLDSSSNQFLITRSGNATQGTFSPFSPGGWSYYFNGTASASQAILTPTNAQYAIGTGQFSIESWVYLQSKSTSSGNSIHTIISQGNNANNLMWALGIIDSTNYISWGLTGSGITLSAYPVTKNTWNHIVVTRNASNEERIFLNGTLINLRTNTTNYSNASSTQIQIGTNYDTNYPSAYGVNSYGNTFSGYISQLRLDIGGIPSAYQTSSTTVGQTIFTPPATLVIATPNTKLLIGQDNRFKDNSTINAVLTPNGNTSVQAFSPFATTAVYNPVSHGGSAYFDGTGDYLSIPNNSAFDFGSGDFSIEAWVYVPNVSGSKAIITKDDAARSWIFDLNNADAFFAIPGSTTSTLTNAVQANTWVHLYFGRSGNTMYKAVNGSVSSDAWTTTIPTTSTAVEIGRQGGYGNPFNGYISGLRVLKGSAAYTSNFTPSAPPTAISNTVLLTNFADAAILDSTGRTVIETVADARTSSVVTKFTGGSMYFDGTGDGLAWPISSTPFYQIVSTNWTIEMWMYKFSTAIKNIMRCGPANAGNINRGWSIGIDPSINTIYFSSSGADNTFTGATIAINTWVHLAFSYTVSDSTLRVFYNGTSAGTKVSPALVNPTIAGGDFLTVATPYSGTAHFDGYLSDIRFTQGYARYTANFTAPTAPARLK